MNRAHPLTVKTPFQRALSLDALRGIIMALMAIRHAEIFLTGIVTAPEMWGGPLPELHFGLPFWTRFFGHMCPTGFFFLMGVGMTLFAKSRIKKGWAHKKIISHFVLRGLILAALQFILANPLWIFDNPSRVYTQHQPVIFYFGVLFSLGMSFVINSLILRFNWIVIFISAMFTIVLTYIILPAPSMYDSAYPLWLRIFSVPGQTANTLVLFSILPWLSFTALGMVFGKWFVADRKTAFRRAGVSGVVCILLFFLIRLNGHTGNLRPFVGDDWRLFFFITKFPPSLAYICITLGEILLLLWILSRMNSILDKWATPLLVYGRCPLFFYFVHITLLAFAGQIFFRNGAGLLWMYITTFIVLVIMYPLCKYYARFKLSKKSDSLWRFF